MSSIADELVPSFRMRVMTLFWMLAVCGKKRLRFGTLLVPHYPIKYSLLVTSGDIQTPATGNHSTTEKDEKTPIRTKANGYRNSWAKYDEQQ